MSFLQQWLDNVEQSCVEVKAGMMNKLQGLSTTAEEVCSAMQEEVERLATRDRTAGDRLQKMLEETAALKSEGKKIIDIDVWGHNSSDGQVLRGRELL